ncbi:ABC transporter permease [Georgenia sp. Z1491]|uniref:ABC transporter permease n=1 Tax=Georgenia sp. Z1491 TaxID=3416707 RepID=UPI003CE84305
MTTQQTTTTAPDVAGRPPAAGSTQRRELPPATPRRSGPLGRIASLAAAELKVLGRNSVAAFYAVLMAPAMVLLMTTLPIWEDIAGTAGPAMSVRVLGMLVVFGIVMAIYYNLTTAAVARRESLALKRQVSGTARPWEVLTALAVPNVAVFLAQVVVVLGVVIWRMEMPAMTNPLIAVVGILLGAVVFALLSYVTTIVTRTAESAQLTTMPMMLVGLVISGALVPMSVLPDRAQTVLELLPVLPVTELVSIGFGGTTLAGQDLSLAQTFAEAGRPVAVLAVWAVVLAAVVSRRMPFEPRR